MPIYRIRLINSDFESSDEFELSSLDLAREAALTTATRIVSEAAGTGERASAVEVQIFEHDALISRQVVMLSIADFTTGE